MPSITTFLNDDWINFYFSFERPFAMNFGGRMRSTSLNLNRFNFPEFSGVFWALARKFSSVETDRWLKYLARNIWQVNEKLSLLLCFTLLFLLINFIPLWSLFGLYFFLFYSFSSYDNYHRILRLFSENRYSLNNVLLIISSAPKIVDEKFISNRCGRFFVYQSAQLSWENLLKICLPEPALKVANCSWLFRRRWRTTILNFKVFKRTTQNNYKFKHKKVGETFIHTFLAIFTYRSCLKTARMIHSEETVTIALWRFLL